MLSHIPVKQNRTSLSELNPISDLPVCRLQVIKGTDGDAVRRKRNPTDNNE